MLSDFIETDKQPWSIHPRKLIDALIANPTTAVASLPESIASARLAGINRLISIYTTILVQGDAL